MAIRGPMKLPPELQMHCRSALEFDWRTGKTPRLLQRAHYALSSNPVDAGASIDGEAAPWVAGPNGSVAELTGAAALIDTGLDMDSLAAGTVAVFASALGVAAINPQCGSDGVGFLVSFSVADGDTLQYWRKGATATVQETYPVTAGLWYLIVMDWGSQGTRCWLDGRIVATDATVEANGTNSGRALMLNRVAVTFGDNQFGFFGFWNVQMGGRVSQHLLRARRAAA